MAVPDDRRWFAPGGTYFFTVVTAGRVPLFAEPAARAILRTALVACRQRWPFTTEAVVLLPDHWHALWTLPSGDTDDVRRLAFVKRSFSGGWLARSGCEQAVGQTQQARRRCGVWQARYCAEGGCERRSGAQ